MMRGKDYNTGLRGVLFEARHYERMGSAVWLYAWLVLRQTHQSGSTGWVLGGAPISYREIEEETGFNPRTLERWMRVLRRHGYIETEPAMGGLIVQITKAKKHAHSARNSASTGKAETLHRAAAEIRKLADGPRKVAEGCTQNCVADRQKNHQFEQLTSPIGSSSIEKSIEKYGTEFSNHGQRKLESNLYAVFETNTKFQSSNPSCSGESQNPQLTQGRTTQAHTPADLGRSGRTRNEPPQKPWLARDEVRLQLELLRAEREEAVRRELYVGRGPKIRQTVPPDPQGPEVKLR